MEQYLIQIAVPRRTPAGLEITAGLKADYLKQVQISSIPTLCLETAISEREWAIEGSSGADRNTIIDKFHLISALPYVDEIVSDDHFFHDIYPTAEKTGHLRATLLHNQEFLQLFN